MKSLNTDNPQHLLFEVNSLQLEVLGGIDLKHLNRLKTTLKINREGYRSLRDQLDLYQDGQTSRLQSRIAEKLETGTSLAEKAIYELTENLELYRLNAIASRKEKREELEQPLIPNEIKEAQEYLSKKDLFQRLSSDLQQSGIVGEEQNALILYLCMISRKLSQPLSAICFAKSGVGKSHLMERVAKCMYQKDVLDFTQLTENSLYYMEKYYLRKKLILVEDLDGAKTVLLAIRELISKGMLSKSFTGKDEDGEFKAKERTVYGPSSVIACTTQEQVYEDNANRSILIYLDNSEAQDKRIMAYQKELEANQIDPVAQQLIQHKLQLVDRVLQPLKIVNPYAPLLELPKEVFKPRRTMAILLNFIKTITYLHQYQREKLVDQETGEEYIQSTIEDIEQGFELLETTLLRKADELTESQRSFYNWLQSWLNEDTEQEFSTKDIRTQLRQSPRTIQRHLRALTEYGKVEVTTGNPKTGYRYKLAQNEENLTEQIKTQIGQVLKRVRMADRKMNKSNI